MIEWINIKNKLPPKDKPFLAYFEGSFMICKFHDNPSSTLCDSCEEYSCGDYSHWAVLDPPNK
jgi:hypothetical protein